MPAVVFVAAPGRACRVRCADCDLDEGYERTAPAQTAARQHNDTVHAFPPELDLDTDQEPTA